MKRLRVLLPLFVWLLAVSVSAQTRTVTADQVRLNTVPCTLTSGSGDPSGGANCDMYLKSDGTLWVKANGAWTGIALGGNVGIGTTAPGTPLDVVGNIKSRTGGGGFYLANTSDVFRGALYDDGSQTLLFTDGNGSVPSLRFDGVYVEPGTNHTHDLGADSLRWRSLYAADLNVWRLVAKDVIASIGGEIWTARTTKLTADLTDSATEFTVENNDFNDGDYAILKDLLHIEILKVCVGDAGHCGTASPTGSAGAYVYQCYLVGGGGTTRQVWVAPSAWAAGTALVNTGSTVGDGWIAQYAENSAAIDGWLSTTTAGPSMVGMVRYSPDYWYQSRPRWAVGNLKGLYNYGATSAYGLAAGDSYATYVTVDATNGFRVMKYNGGTPAAVVSVDASGNGTYTGGITVGTTDKLWLNDSGDGELHIGGSTKASAPFGVSSTGVMTAIGGTFKSAASGARVELTSTGMVGYNAGGDTLFSLKGDGLHVQKSDYSTQFDGAKSVSFLSTTSGMQYYDMVELVDDGGKFRLAQYSGGSRILSWDFDNADSTVPTLSGANAAGLARIGYPTRPLSTVWAKTYSYSDGAFDYRTGWTDTCSSGITAIEVAGGIVTSVSCASPNSTPASELAALRSLVLDLQARLAALEGSRR